MKKKKLKYGTYSAEALHKKANEIIPVPPSATIPEFKFAKKKR